MSTDAITSRFGGLGPYAGSSLEDLAGPRRVPDARAQAATPPSTELRVSKWVQARAPTAAQSLQLGISTAQAGGAVANWLEGGVDLRPSPAATPATSGRYAPVEPRGRPRGSAGDESGRRVPITLTDMLAQAPTAAEMLRSSGSELQAWLDIATGRLALQAVEEIHSRAAQAQPEGPQPVAPEAAAPAQEVEPAAAESVPAPPQKRQPSALEEARRSFESALQYLDDELESQLAAAQTRVGRDGPAAAAESLAASMREQPERAAQAHAALKMPGVLALLRWDFTPLTEPLPEQAAAQA